MSELKYQLMLNKYSSWVPCYLKSEADKVIAEKDEKIAKLKALLWLRKRTMVRENRGVEGTHKV